MAMVVPWTEEAAQEEPKFRIGESSASIEDRPEDADATELSRRTKRKDAIKKHPIQERGAEYTPMHRREILDSLASSGL